MEKSSLDQRSQPLRSYGIWSASSVAAISAMLQVRRFEISDEKFEISESEIAFLYSLWTRALNLMRPHRFWNFTTPDGV
jgi:hypothetical protein